MIECSAEEFQKLSLDMVRPLLGGVFQLCSRYGGRLYVNNVQIKKVHAHDVVMYDLRTFEEIKKQNRSLGKLWFLLPGLEY